MNLIKAYHFFGIMVFKLKSFLLMISLFIIYFIFICPFRIFISTEKKESTFIDVSFDKINFDKPW